MKCINVWVLLVVVCGAFCGAKQLPSFIQRCKRANPEERNKCIMQRIEVVKSHLIEGIPELKLPRIDPLHVPKVEAQLGDDKALGFNIVLTDIDFYGVKNFHVPELKLDLETEKKSLFLHVYIPDLRTVAKYAAKGKLAVFEFDTTGVAQINMTEIHAKANRKVSIVTRNGKDYVNLEDDHDLEVKYETVSLYFDNLINNNKELTEQTNRAINENYDQIATEIDYVVHEGVHAVIHGIVKKFIDEYSLDELFE